MRRLGRQRTWSGPVATGLALTLLAVIGGMPRPLAAQALFVDVSVEQASAAEPLPSPVGFSLALGRTRIVGPFGIQAGLRTLYEGGSDVARRCTFASCTSGPFGRSYSVRLLYAGVSYDFRNSTDIYLNLGLNVGSSAQTEHFTHLESGEESEVDAGEETTLGGSVHLRLRPLVGPFRPVFAGRYDRLFESDCLADAACVPGRDVWTISVGLSWVAPAG